MNEKNFDNVLRHIDLYKAYGEFNFLFEDTIQHYRLLVIEIIRISHNYFEEEDENQNELEYKQRDRLLKILMHNMGAMEIIENCKTCFIDFSAQQKEKTGSFSFKRYDAIIEISDESFSFLLNVFKKSVQLVEFRNQLIHSYFSESLKIPEFRNTDLIGQKNVKSSKGFEHRQFSLSQSFLEKINEMILDLQLAIGRIHYILVVGDDLPNERTDHIARLSRIDFKIV